MVVGLFGLKSGKERCLVSLISGPGLGFFFADSTEDKDVVVMMMMKRRRRNLWRNMIGEEME